MSKSARGLVLALLTVAVLLFAPGAAAQGVYVGGSYSSTSIDVPGLDLLGYSEYLDDSSNGYKLFIGYEFTPNVGIEGAWADLGTFDIDPDLLADYGYDPTGLSADGFGVSVIGNIPAGKTVTFFARVGYFFWDAEFTGDAQLIDEAQAEGIPTKIDGEDLFYGLGLRVNIGKVAIQGEWEKYEFGYEGEEADADAFSLGVRFKF